MAEAQVEVLLPLVTSQRDITFDVFSFLKRKVNKINEEWTFLVERLETCVTGNTC